MTPENQEKINQALMNALEQCTPEIKEMYLFGDWLERQINNAFAEAILKKLEEDSTPKRHLRLVE